MVGAHYNMRSYIKESCTRKVENHYLKVYLSYFIYCFHIPNVNVTFQI